MRRTKSHFPIMSFSRNIKLSGVNGWRPGGCGGWPKRCPNERVCCWILGEGDERGEGDGEFVRHQSLLFTACPAALPHHAHVSEGSNTGLTAALPLFLHTSPPPPPPSPLFSPSLPSSRSLSPSLTHTNKHSC